MDTRGPTILDPAAIERESFAIIEREMGEHGFSELEWPIVRRVIHTSADFDFARNTLFSPGAVASALAAIRGGAAILCDTNMALAGVNRVRLAQFRASIHCHVGDAEVAALARAKGITRSTLALRKGVEAGCSIFAIGNAPTALFELLRLIREGAPRPALVIGAPVGFVGAQESKEALIATDLPYIACRGRKGGSTIVTAILNALLILAEEGK